MPNTREKLIELLIKCGVWGVSKTIGEIADYLIANGVVVQKHGRWRKFTRHNRGIKKEDGFTAGCCGRWVPVKTAYCPNCGAKMDGDGNG